MNTVRTTALSSPLRHARRTRSVLAAVFSLLSLRKSRQDLASLDPHLLRDIGLTEDEAKTEAKRAVWDVPTTWRL